MTNEEKQLLTNVICAGLQYGLKAQVWAYWSGDYFDEELVGIDLDEGDVLVVALPGDRCEIEKVKPYLRSMSSMTGEEKKEYITLLANTQESLHYIPDEKPMVEFVGWLNEHHLDYHNLIEKGLALEAPEDMYNNK